MAFTHIWQALAALFFALFGPAHMALAQPLLPVPALTARLIDQTHTLTAQQATTIESRLRTIAAQSGSQVVVLMVPTTAPEDIAPYAHRVASTWKIGRKDVGDGLLVVIAKDDRRVRMEVARAVEGAFPDWAASRRIEQQMAPHVRQTAWAAGMWAALDQSAAGIAGGELPAASAAASHQAAGVELEGAAIFLFLG